MTAAEQNKFASVDESSGSTPDLTNLKNLRIGRVDLVICEVSVCQHLVKTHSPDLDGLDYSSTVIGSVQTMRLAFSEKWPGAEQLTKEFNATLAKFSAALLWR